MTWDSEAKIYRDDDGNPVPPERVRSWMEDWAAALVVLFAARAEAARRKADAAGFGSNDWLDAMTAWQSETIRDLRAAMYASSSVAFGGLKNTDVADWTIADIFVNEQIGFFQNFAAGVFAGAIVLNGMFAPRAGMYGSAAFGAYENSVREREKRDRRFSEERRQLGAPDHCVDCLEQAAIGWQPVGALRRIGDSVCLSRCKCFFIYR